MRAKRRAELEFGVDLDERLLPKLSDLRDAGIQIIHDDGIRFLEDFPFEGHEVVYCDPPYYPTARKRKRVYRHDLDHDDHIRLLAIITRLNAKVIISGYDNEIYRQYLNDWHVRTYSCCAHDGIRKEFLWHNFSAPSQLHDYRYLGSNFRERQNIRRRIERIQRRLGRLSNQECFFLQEWLTEKVGLTQISKETNKLEHLISRNP